MSTDTQILTELNAAATGAIIMLYEIDLTAIGNSKYYFTNEPLDTPLYFGGIPYVPFPIVVEGIGSTTGEAPSRPTLTISNVNHELSVLVNTLGDIIGSSVTRIRTFARFLDGGATPNGNAYLPKDKYIIAQKLSHNKVSIQFELNSRLDIEYEKLPRRMMLRDDINGNAGFPGLSVDSRFRQTQ